MNLPDFLRQDQYGEIFLAGHRVCLHHIINRYVEGASPELIAFEFPTVSLALIHKVIAYYLENREDVDHYLHDVNSEIERQASAGPHGPSFEELRRRMASRIPAKSA